MSYRVELWGSKEREDIERIEERYLMNIRSGQRDAGLFGKGGIPKREAKGKSWKEGLGTRKEEKRKVRWRGYAGRS